MRSRHSVSIVEDQSASGGLAHALDAPLINGERDLSHEQWLPQSLFQYNSLRIHYELLALVEVGGSARLCHQISDV